MQIIAGLLAQRRLIAQALACTPAQMAVFDLTALGLSTGAAQRRVQNSVWTF